MKTLLRVLAVSALLVGAPGAARAATTGNTDTTVDIIQPALEITVTEGTIRFGDAAGVTSAQYYDGTGLTLTVHDYATENQTTTGWTVSAVASDLVGDGGSIWAGELTFGGDPGMATFTQQSGPVGTGVALESPFDSSPFSIDFEQPIFGAAADNGKGEWTAELNPGAFVLYVPGETAAGDYTGTLTFTVARRL